MPRSSPQSSSDKVTSGDGARPSDGRAAYALVVDDAPDITFLFAFILQQAGYKVVTADSAPEALVAAHRGNFDLIVSDIGMPRMDGYELAKALRATPGYEGVLMIAVTGFDKSNDRDRALQSGFDAYLTKPVDPEALLELIARLRNSGAQT